MSAAIRAVVLLDGHADPAAFDALVPPGAPVEFVEARPPAEAGPLPPGDLVLVLCAGESEAAVEVVRDVTEHEPGRPVVVVCAGSPNGFVGRAFAAGADDILVLPESPEKVLFALEKAVARRSGVRAAPEGAAPFTCVLGPKGGTGKTVTTANLAVSLATAGVRTVVVDLDLQFGDVALALGLAPERTSYDLARSGGSLDAEKLDDYLATHPSGVRALLAPVRPDQASAVSADLLRDVWHLLRQHYDRVIVDSPPDFTPEVIAAVDASTEVCLVGMLDSLSIKNTKLGLETLELMGYDPAAVRVVLNRADSRVGISSADVARVLGRHPDVMVPSDRDIPLSINEGVPIVLSRPRSEAARAFRALAALYGAGVPEAPRRRRRLLARGGRA